MRESRLSFLHGEAMNLARMMTDQFFIEDRSGARSGPFKTKFGSDSIMVFRDDLTVTPGDRIIRPRSDGSEQVYVVEHSALNTGSRNIPRHFAIRIAEPATAQGAAIPAAPAAVHAASVDLPHIAASLQSLADAIERADFPLEQKNEARTSMRTLLENPVVAAILAGTTCTS